MSFDPRQRAILYGAYKHLESWAKANDGPCELSPGTEIDVSGEVLTITLPPKTIVSRSEGENGDGRCYKKATQNLYGWSILYAFVYQAERILGKFNQAKRFRKLLQPFLTRIVRQALDTGNTSEEAFRKAYPQVAKGIDELKSSLNVPMRNEPIPRKCPRDAKLPATLAFGQLKKKRKVA